jgi:hypothetical protein
VNDLKASDFMALQACMLKAPQRRELMAHRRARSVSLGPAMRLQFEDELTLRHQIGEVLRAERVTDPEAMQREIDTYAHLMPDGTQWKATLLIQLPDTDERARELPPLSEAAHQIYVECERQGRVFAQANEDLTDRHLTRPSAVHFLRFQLPEPLRLRLRDGAPATLGCTHERYHWRRLIPPTALRLLRADLCAAELNRNANGSRFEHHHKPLG